MKPIGNFIAALLAGAAILGSTACSTTTRRTVDVLIIGGTTSGTSAAIAAARQGVRTLVVEPTPMLGGMLTAQGVSAIDGNDQLPSGFWNEFREALRRHYGGASALATGWVSVTQFEPHVADSIFKAMAAAEPTLEVIHGYRLEAVRMKERTVTGASFLDERGHRLEVEARTTIDATDLGEALPMSGTPYRVGMDSRALTGEAIAPEEANDIVQDLTVVAVLKDYGEGADRTIPRPEGYDPAEFEGCCGSGERTMTPEYMLRYGRLPGGKYMINWPTKGNDCYLNVVELPWEERIEALRPAREKTLRFVYYIQHELGFRNLGIADDEFATEDGLAYLPYHREGRRLDGVVRLTLDDVAARYDRPTALYRTGVSVGDYPVDHHHACYPGGLEKIPFPPVPSFSIPAGVMIPAATEQLLVADKAISVSNLINGSTRLQPVVLLTGQAAGTLAALAVKAGCTPREVPVRTLQRALLGQKAYIAPTYDVRPDDPDFELLQRIAATGILRLTGEPFHWANRSWFYPEEGITVGEFTRGLKDYAPQIDVEESDKPLTAAAAAALLRRAGGAADTPADGDRPLTRRETARMVEEALHPFDRDIDFEGNLINL